MQKLTRTDIAQPSSSAWAQRQEGRDGRRCELRLIDEAAAELSVDWGGLFRVRPRGLRLSVTSGQRSSWESGSLV
jgi:hypothetical protein